MFSWLDDILGKIKELNISVDNFKKDTVIQSLPSLTYVNRAKKLIEQDKFEEAREVLKKALELPQKDALVYKYLGICEDQLKNVDAAVEYFQMSADINPQDKGIWMALGFSLISAKKYENAVKSFENANRVNPAHSDNFMGWGMALMKLQKYEEALDKFTKSVKFNKFNFNSIFLSAVMEIKLKMYDKAESKLIFLSNVAPNAKNTYEFANLKMLKGDFQGAIHYGLKSLEFDSTLLPTYILLAKAKKNLYEYDEAVEFLKKAEENNLVDALLYYYYSIIYEAMGDYNKAKEYILKAKDLEPEDIDVLSHLGLCCIKLKQYDEAKPFLEQALKIDGNNLVVKQTLGIIKFENKKYEEAIELFKSNDEDFQNCFYLAKCYAGLNNNVKVKDYFESSILKNPKYIPAYIDYARFLANLEEFEEAQRKLRKALKFSPENIDLLNLMFKISYILVKKNLIEYNVKETLAIANKVENINPNLFEYPNEKAELQAFLERDKN